MALFFADLVREACWDEGAGDLALAGALPGHRSFADTVPAGARFHYAIAGVTHPGQWETGEGEIVGGQLARSPFASSDDGDAVDFTAGLKTVALTVSAEWFAARDGGVATIEDVAGLSEALTGKAATGHGHGFSSLSGRPTTLAGYGITDAAASGHQHDGAYQPLDPDLTAVAALTTTSFGRAHLTLADAAALRGHAELGSLAAQDSGSVAITGGNISGITDLAVADGGTGASSAAAARTNLGLGTIATQAASGVSISGGSISGLSALSVGNGTVQALLDLNGGNPIGGGLRFQREGAGHVFIGDTGSALGTGTGAIIYTYGNDPILFYANGGEAARVTSGGLAVAGTISISGSQIAGARRTGWTAPSGTAARGGFDTASVTTEALAQRVKALIDDLAAHGLIGA